MSLLDLMGRPKKYNTPEEAAEAKRKQNLAYYHAKKVTTNKAGRPSLPIKACVKCDTEFRPNSLTQDVCGGCTFKKCPKCKGKMRRDSKDELCSKCLYDRCDCGKYKKKGYRFCYPCLMETRGDCLV